MAVTDPPRAHLALAAAETLQAFADLMGALRAIPSVRKLALSRLEPFVELWVLLGEENLDDMERAFLVERGVRQRHGVLPLNMHVVALGQVDEANLPSMDTIFERP